MKKITLYIALLCLAALQACSVNDEPMPEPQAAQGTIVFKINKPQLKTRANTDFSIQSIVLLVCDDNERILQKATTAESADTYTAQVVYSNQKRIVHFIANYDWSDWSDEYVGKDAREVLAGVSTNQFTAWKRIELPAGITGQTPFGTDPIELICNMAKFTLDVKKDLTDVSFAIYNYDRGTIATFNPRSGGTNLHKFEEGVITVPHDVQLKVPTPVDFVPMANAIFTFERDNATAIEDYSCIIIRGKYEGTETYYKVDIVNSENKRVDISRNHSYNITISGVNNLGHTSIAAAIASAADNTNFSLDPSLEVFPVIADGMRKLQVDRNFIVVTDASHSANFKATYSVRSGSEWNVDNTKISVAHEEVEGFNPSVNSVSFDSSTGIVTVDTKPLNGKTLCSKVMVKVEYQDGLAAVNLYRAVKVISRPAFVLTAEQIGTVIKTQKAVMNAKVEIPTDFPEELLPIGLRFKTNNFFPHPDNPMRLTIEDETPVYIYTVTNVGVHNLKFLSNRANSAETIEVTANYFAPVNMEISNE